MTLTLMMMMSTMMMTMTLDNDADYDNECDGVMVWWFDGDGDDSSCFPFFPTSLRPSTPPCEDASVHPAEAFIQHFSYLGCFFWFQAPHGGRITNGMYHGPDNGPEHCWARTVLRKTSQMSP